MFISILLRMKVPQCVPCRKRSYDKAVGIVVGIIRRVWGGDNYRKLVCVTQARSRSTLGMVGKKGCVVDTKCENW